MNLVDDGIRLVDHVGAIVATPDPTVDGRTVTLPIPAGLPEGPYVLTWRVVSSDGHPVSGALSFGVGTAAVAVPGSGTGDETSGTGASTVATGSSAPWPVVVSRVAGYIAFALVAGVAAFVLFCAPGSSKDPTLQLLVRCGLVAGTAAAVAAILVQGAYAAGVSMSRVLDMRLLQETLSTPFGMAMMWRLALYGVLGVLAWRLPRILSELASWLVPAAVVGLAVTIAAAGHAAASGPLDLLVVALTRSRRSLGRRPGHPRRSRPIREPRALHRSSTLAMASVLTIVVTGTLNSLRHLTAVEQLWLTRYGLTLVIKLSLVAGALTAAAVSRRRMGQNRVPRRSLRLEAALTVTVLIVTALLSTTSPPPRQAAGPTNHAGHDGGPAAANDTVKMSLGDQGEAALAVLPATTTGSHLHLVLTDTSGQKLPATGVTLKVANPGRDITPIPVPMTMRDGVWVASYRFPFPGTWKTVLTVDGVGPSAVVTSAEFTIRD